MLSSAKHIHSFPLNTSANDMNLSELCTKDTQSVIHTLRSNLWKFVEMKLAGSTPKPASLKVSDNEAHEILLTTLLGYVEARLNVRIPALHNGNKQQ